MDRWIAANTYHHASFSDIEALVTEKQRQNLSVSLCIPTLNEEKTIGKEIVILRSELMSRFPLIDEIAVIDSGSEDDTMEIARRYGADVYLSSDILPGEGFKRGKGENLWKAVYQLKGDIICYVDADISNIHPRFVYGLVGPLIRRPEVKYVKAFYNRPLKFRKKVRPGGGGRVTEILVRPMFSLFYPELTGIIQPLSGEYAVRRDVLEKIPFPIGYGVETSHLLDVYHDFGLKAFAQTDLDQRVHRNQTTAALGRMSFGILQGILRRLEKHGKIGGVEAIEHVHRSFRIEDDDQCVQVPREIVEEERPPMVEIEAYRRKHKL